MKPNLKNKILKIIPIIYLFIFCSFLSAQIKKNNENDSKLKVNTKIIIKDEEEIKKKYLNPDHKLLDPKIDETLIQDEHFREEYGVNKFTVPSIKKIIAILENFKDLKYEKLKRDLPRQAPIDRAELATAIGGVIAEGFLQVQCERYNDLEEIARILISYTGKLGAGNRVNKHTKAIMKAVNRRDMKTLKSELAKTQADVEAEIILLRDVNIANLISLGGWIRALQIITTAMQYKESSDAQDLIKRADLADYYLNELTYAQNLKKRPFYNTLINQLETLRDFLRKKHNSKLSKEDISYINNISSKIVETTLPKN